MYCPGCSLTTKPFAGDICPKCESVAESCRSPIAREYVADYFRDHPLTIPRQLLQRMQEA